MLDRTLDDFDDAGGAAAHLIRFELAMLAELGFGLDLENCAATGETADLIYVSPKSGGAVSRRGRRAVPGPPAAAAGLPARRRGRGERLVGPGPAGRFSPDRAVPAPPRAGTARAGPFRRQGRVHQRGDAAPGANQFGFVSCSRPSTGRPCESRDPYAAAHQFGAAASAIFRHKHRWLWVPAFAGTTVGGAAAIPVLPDSAEKFNASPWENDSCRRKNRPKSTRSCCAMRWKSAISPTRSRPSCTAPCRTPATG